MMMRRRTMKKNLTSLHLTTARRRIRKEIGRKRVLKKVMMTMMNISVNIVADKGIQKTSVGCWIRIREKT
jgi:hypothetical protein